MASWQKVSRHGSISRRNQHGYRRQQRGYQQQWYQPQGYQPQGYQPQGYQHHGYQPQGYQQHGYQQHGYQQHGYQQHGYQQGYQQHGYQQGYQQHGYQQQGYQQQGYQECNEIYNIKQIKAELFSLMNDDTGFTEHIPTRDVIINCIKEYKKINVNREFINEINDNVMINTVLGLCIGNLFNSLNPNIRNIIQWIHDVFIPLTEESKKLNNNKSIDSVAFMSRLIWQKGLTAEKIENYIIVLKTFIDNGFDPHKKEGIYNETARQSFESAKSSCYECITEEQEQQILNLLCSSFKPKEIQSMINRILTKVTSNTLNNYANKAKIVLYYDIESFSNKILDMVTIETETPKSGYFKNTHNIIEHVISLIKHPIVDDDYKNCPEIKNISVTPLLEKLKNNILIYKVKTTGISNRNPSKLGALMGTICAVEQKQDNKMINRYVTGILTNNLNNIPLDNYDKTFIHFISHYITDSPIDKQSNIFESFNSHNKQLLAAKKFMGRDRFLLMDIFDKVYGRGKKPLFMEQL